MTQPSPMALVCITLMIAGALTIDGVPEIFREEVLHFYPLLSGKPVEEPETEL